MRAILAPTLSRDQAPFGIRYVNGQDADIEILLKRQAARKSLGATTLSYIGNVPRQSRIDMAMHTAARLPLDSADIQNIAPIPQTASKVMEAA